jgi:hypothetical protein
MITCTRVHVYSSTLLFLVSSPPAAASRILRAVGIKIMHKQAYMMAALIQELRNEEQFLADFARIVSMKAEGSQVWTADTVHISGAVGHVLFGTHE